MHTFMKRSTVLPVLMLMVAALLMGGCFRKHIESAPPVKRPATQAAPAETDTPEPAPEPIAETVEPPAETPVENPDIIAETYEVNAAESSTLPQVEETDLGEPITEEIEVAPAGTTVEEQPAVAADDAAAPAADSAPLAESTEEAQAMEVAETAETPAPQEAAPMEMTDPETAAAPETEAMTETASEPVTEPAAETVAEKTPTPAEPKADAEPAAGTATVAGAETVADTEPAAKPESADSFINPEEEVVEIGDAPAVAAPVEMHYVQVGAFSMSENAEKVLATLVDQGYPDSKITMSTKGLYLVRAGGFEDETTARVALDKLKELYPSSFIVKWNPAAK